MRYLVHEGRRVVRLADANGTKTAGGSLDARRKGDDAPTASPVLTALARQAPALLFAVVLLVVLAPSRATLGPGPRARRPGHRVSLHGNKAGPQGRWNSTEAAQRAANQATGKSVHTVLIQPGDGTVVHPLEGGGSVWLRQADKAVAISKSNGTAHTLSIGSGHDLY
ncbi:MAG: hypothetical protein MUF34_33720 [Polyangiaceae bacterium]|nr:hypothetical protein [Polyangiaceae bacterium]